ncbi:type II secretion system minor pseudopilin GspK [Granulosicoccaceae sp. 1_MG-2023]|nr:type II secretion system minor pseudopilin GspK [Granulosicoccaceae sp. 1_MG-2023]
MNSHKQQGVAIITVLLMVALATITVVAMTSQQRLDIRRAANQQALQQARSLALGGEKFAAATLMRDKTDELTADTDTLGEEWAQSLPPLPVDQSTIKGCVFDMQGRFNLNNLLTGNGSIDSQYYSQLQRLLSALAIDSAKADAIADWLDEDSETTGSDGAEEDYYSGLDVPYRPANREMVSISELKLVKGFNPADEDEMADLQVLLPHVAALPGVTLVNVNTATPAVIASLSDEIGEKADDLTRWDDDGWESYPECEDVLDVAELVETVAAQAEGGERESYDSVDDFISAAGVADDDLSDRLSVSSEFFRIRVDVATGETGVTQFTLVRRLDQGASEVLQRSRQVF